jgi:hypothetical protein
VAIAQFYPLRARAIIAHGINRLSPKRFKHFWREFRKFYNFRGDRHCVRSGRWMNLGPRGASPRCAELRRGAERKSGLSNDLVEVDLSVGYTLRKSGMKRSVVMTIYGYARVSTEELTLAA